jgi:hypothetical protein
MQLSPGASKTLDVVLNVLGFFVRCAIGFGVCLWLCSVFSFAYGCFSPGASPGLLQRLVYCPLTSIFFSLAPLVFGFPPEEVIVSAIVALPIAIIWGRVCRRHCLPVREWF